MNTEMNKKKKNIDWSGKTILVAEDVQTNFMLIEAILDKTQAKLIWARNGEEAVNLCRKNRDIDMVLMDIQMPVMDGIEATLHIKKIRGQLPVIAQTAYAFDYEDRIKEAGCDQIVTKPISPGLLIDAMEKHMNGKEEHARL